MARGLLDDYRQMATSTGRLKNRRRSGGQKEQGLLGGGIVDAEAALIDAYNQFELPDDALGLLSLPAKAAVGLGRMALTDISNLTQSIMQTDRSDPDAMARAATDGLKLMSGTGMAGGLLSRMTGTPKGAIRMNVFGGGIHDLGKLGKEHLMRRYGYGDGDIYPEQIYKGNGTYGPAPLTQAQKNRASKHGDNVRLNLSTNRNDDKSAYLSGPFGEFRISDHYNNPNFNNSDMNATNPSAKEVVGSIDDAMGRVNKSRLEVQTKLDEYEIPLNKIKAKLLP